MRSWRLLQKLKAGVPEDTLARMDAARGDDTRSAWLLQLRNAAECHARTFGIELSISP